MDAEAINAKLANVEEQLELSEILEELLERRWSNANPEQRCKELVAKEAQLQEAAHTAQAAASAAAAWESKLQAREVAYLSPALTPVCS